MTCIPQARKENNQPVVQQLETVLRAAMTEKQKTLRPEIQLLNTLLQVSDKRQRKLVRCFLPNSTLVAHGVPTPVVLQMMQDPAAKQVRLTALLVLAASTLQLR